MNLQENIARIKEIIEQNEPESGKCGITRACEKQEKEYSKRNAEADKLSAIQQKQDQKFYTQQAQKALDMDFNYLDDRRTKSEKDFIRSEFEKIKNSPSFQGKSTYKPEQKFAILYKVFENFKRRPELSYAQRLKTKFNIADLKSVTLEQLSNMANQLGWDFFINWYQSGGPEIKS